MLDKQVLAWNVGVSLVLDWCSPSKWGQTRHAIGLKTGYYPKIPGYAPGIPGYYLVFLQKRSKTLQIRSVGGPNQVLARLKPTPGSGQVLDVRLS